MFSHEAGARMSIERSEFIACNNRDVHYDFHDSRKIPGLLNQIGVYTGKMPLFYSTCMMVLLDLIMIGWIQRLVMLTTTGRTCFSVRKYIIR